MGKENKLYHRKRNSIGYEMKDIILGGQDGLVNVLGVVLGIAAIASQTGSFATSIVLAGGLAATFAESISMAAVAYTSTKALKDYYTSEKSKELTEIKNMPVAEKRQIREIYHKKGFRGNLLNSIVNHITSDRGLWLETMMTEELKISSASFAKPLTSSAIVGLSAMVGSLVPLIPFTFFPVASAVVPSLLISVIVLFFLGAAKGKLTIGNWLRSGLEIAIIGTAAALIGYGIGSLFNVVV